MSDFDDELQAAEKFFARRKCSREPYFIDARPQIASAAFERDNQRAWKFCKAVFWALVVTGMLAALLWTF
jgi:hypothetical protein